MITEFSEYKEYKVGDYIKLILGEDGLNGGVWKLYAIINNIDLNIYEIDFISSSVSAGKILDSWVTIDEIERLLTSEEKREMDVAMDVAIQSTKYNL